MHGHFILQKQEDLVSKQDKATQDLEKLQEEMEKLLTAVGLGGLIEDERYVRAAKWSDRNNS